MNNIEIFKKKTLDRGLFNKLTNIVEDRGIDEAASFITILSDKEHRLTLEDAYVIANWALGNEEKTDIIEVIKNDTKLAEKRITSTRSNKKEFLRILNEVKIEMYKNSQITHKMLQNAKKQALLKLVTQ